MKRRLFQSANLKQEDKTRNSANHRSAERVTRRFER